MVTVELNDEDSVKAIQDFVRNTPDINVYEYIRGTIESALLVARNA